MANKTGLKVSAENFDSVQLTLNMQTYAALKTIQTQLSELIAHQKGSDVQETVLRHCKMYEEALASCIVDFGE